MHWKVREPHVYIIGRHSPPSLRWPVPPTVGLLSVVLYHETGLDLAGPGGYHVSVYCKSREQEKAVWGM